MNILCVSGEEEEEDEYEEETESEEEEGEKSEEEEGEKLHNDFFNFLLVYKDALVSQCQQWSYVDPAPTLSPSSEAG